MKGARFMYISKKVLAVIAGLFLITVIAGGLLIAIPPVRVSMAQAPTPSAQPPTGSTAQNGLNNYRNFFLNVFANRLGLTIEKVKEALIGAFDDTVNQAMKDGVITQAQADRLKNLFTNRLNQSSAPGFIGPFGLGRFGGFGRFGFARGFLMGRGGFSPSSLAKALDMTQANLITELQSGKTIAEVAKENNIDLAQVKTSVLNDLKTRLDQAVQAGNLTQNGADAIYNQFSANFDTLVNRSWNGYRKVVPPGTNY
jgi:hypothetical protein